MKSPTVLSTVPKLYTAQGDVNKKWFVFFNYFNPATGKNERVRIFRGFADCATYQQKLTHGRQLVADTILQLQAGWSPFEKEPHIDTAPNNAAEVLERGRNITQVLTALIERLNKELQWREKTYADYKSANRILQKYLSEKRTQLHLRAVNEKEAQLFLQWLVSERKAGPTTRNKYRAVMRGLWHHMLKTHDVIQNPWREISKLREHREGKMPFNETQARTLKQKIQECDPWLWLVCSFQFHCFMRPVSEVRMLQVQDLDFDTRKVRVKGKYVKTHEPKVLDMPETLYKELKKLGVDKLKSDLYVFGLGGKPAAVPVSKNVFYKRHSKLQKQCGIGADYSLYSWKHTGNVMLYRKFKDVKMNQAINHHSDISTTDVYLRTKGAYNVEQVRTGFPKI